MKKFIVLGLILLIVLIPFVVSAQDSPTPTPTSEDMEEKIRFADEVIIKDEPSKAPNSAEQNDFNPSIKCIRTLGAGGVYVEFEWRVPEEDLAKLGGARLFSIVQDLYGYIWSETWVYNYKTYELHPRGQTIVTWSGHIPSFIGTKMEFFRAQIDHAYIPEGIYPVDNYLPIYFVVNESEDYGECPSTIVILMRTFLSFITGF